MSRETTTEPGVVRWGIRITGGLAALIGAFWLGAWFSGYAARWSGVFITAKTNMALAQLLAGSALLLLGTGRPAGLRRWAGALFSVLVLLIGALTLSENLFGWDLGIDQLLAKEPPGALGTASPNRMGLPGSLSSTLLGTGLLALALRRRRTVPYLGLAVCVINLIPAVGYLYGVGEFYDLPALTGIAWPTVIALFSLGLGLILARWEGGPMAVLLRDDPGGELLRRMLPVTIFVPLVLGFFRLLGELRGLYGTAQGTGLLMIALILIFSAVLWRSAARLSRTATAEREALRQAREAEARYSALFNNKTNGIAHCRVTTDEHGKPVDYVILEVNDAYEEITGIKKEDIEGKRATEVFPGIENFEFDYIGEYGKVGLEGSELSIEVFFEALRQWLSIYAYSPRHCEFIAMFTDITDRKRAEEALEEERARLQAVLDSLPVAVWIADGNSTVIQTNKAVERIWGAAPVPYGIEEYAEYKGWWADTGKPVEAENWALARAVMKGEVSTGEIIDIERFDGTRGTILNNASPITDREGRIIGGVAVAQDITDIRIAEEALRVSEERFRLVAESMVEGLVLFDPEGNLIYQNSASLRIHGFAPDEQVRVAHPDIPVVWNAWDETGRPVPFEEWAVPRMMRGERVSDLVLRIRRPDTGHEFWASYNGSPIYDDQGSLLLSFITIQDITDRKQAEEALARALEETQRDRHFIAAMEGVSEAALMVGPLQEILQAITVKIREGMETHSCTLFLLDQERQELEAVAACNIPEQVGFRIPADDCFVGKILQERRTLYVRDAEHDPLVTNPHVKRAGLRSILGTPLTGRRGVVGVIYVDEFEEREFSPEERRLLETLAARTALVIENAQLLDELSRNFLLLQRALIPPAPRAIPGYGLASTYRPGVRGMEVGGDFYDLSSTEAGCVGIMIGDVVGKGIPSASLATATRSTVRAFMYESSSPSEALTYTNAVINQEKGDPSLFVTVLAAVLDPATGCICYSSAGHPPPAIYRADTGEVEFLENGNPPVGVLDIYEFREVETHLAKGDKIVFYTDGLDEARHDAALFGPEGIERVLREVGGRSPDDVVAALLGAALDWAHGIIHDDTAIIVIERTGE